MLTQLGDELYNYLLKEGPLPPEKVQKIFTQLVGAVTYVHNLNCVHRDLKLENILLDKNENVKLCDFGFTREYEGKSSYLQTFCGTIAYSAPEMLKGEKYAGEKVDIWSLGVILYALLCGELPFDEDDEQLMRTKILRDDPRFPDHMPVEAKTLIGKLLSKRQLLRPSLADILADPFLAEHAPAQQAILKLQQPAPFSTQLEKEVLMRMRSAGVDIDQVIENVLAKRCDALAGWWTLLLEKEERKMIRRERKRKERDAEQRANRRLSAASSRLERIAPTIQEGEENESASFSNEINLPKSRGRRERRSGYYPDLILSDLPGLPEGQALQSPLHSPSLQGPTPVEKDYMRSASSSRQRRPVPPPKEGTIRGARSRGSTLQLVTSNPDLLHPASAVQPRPHRRRNHPFLAQLAHWKHWIMSSAKRGKSPNTKASTSTPNLVTKSESSPATLQPQTPKPPGTSPSTSGGTPGRPAVLLTGNMNSFPPPPRIYTGGSSKRHSLSPSPITPRSTFRRGSSGLRGRKSTSSSVSSIRSVHHTHHHTHSKASSTSSQASDHIPKTPIGTRSPHHSVKVLPATPTANAFPSSVRLVRNPPISSFNESAHWGSSLGSGNGLVFAKRKRSVFKGPMLNGNFGSGLGSSSIDRKPIGPGSHSRSTSLGGRRSGEQQIIEEEDEDVEEVESFEPMGQPSPQIPEVPKMPSLDMMRKIEETGT